MKITVFSTKAYDREHFDLVNKEYGYELYYIEDALTKDTVRLAEKSDCICIFVNDNLDDELIKILPDSVKLISVRASGFNNIDIESASKRNIKVVRVPAYSPHAVAEHTVALLLSLNRKIHKAYHRVREQNFSLERLEGFDIYRKTVGVIGTGKIGAIFADIMRGFGCKILAYDSMPSEEQIKKGTTYVSLKELFESADIVSLHCPLTPKTKHIINEDTLQQMKKGAMIINTSRGKLIDTKAIIKSLKKGHLGYLGIDVYEHEENLFFSDLSEYIIEDDVLTRLMTFPNVLITAHQAFFTQNALNEIAQTTFENITSFFKEGKIQNEVTLNMLKGS